MLLAIVFLPAVKYLATTFAHFSSDKILVRILQNSSDPRCQIILQSSYTSFYATLWIGRVAVHEFHLVKLEILDIPVNNPSFLWFELSV